MPLNIVFLSGSSKTSTELSAVVFLVRKGPLGSAWAFLEGPFSTTTGVPENSPSALMGCFPSLP